MPLPGIPIGNSKVHSAEDLLDGRWLGHACLDLFGGLGRYRGKLLQHQVRGPDGLRGSAEAHTLEQYDGFRQVVRSK